MSALEETAHSTVAGVLAPHETIQVWPADKHLFREGAPVDGVFVIHSGEVDLCFSSPKSGEAKALFVAGPGQILGLSCVVANRPHDCTATTRSECITGFVQSSQFLQLLDGKPDLWINVLRMISSNINACWDCMRELR